MTTNKLSQSFNQLVKAEKVDLILKYLIACCWFQDNKNGEPPVLTPRILKDWMPSFRSDVAMRWLVDSPDDLDNTPVPKEWDDAAHYYLEICFRQHTIDVPEETESASPSDFPTPPLLHKAQTVELVLNELAIAPRLRATFAMVAILDTWEDAPPKNAFFQKYGIRNFEEGIEAAHALWTEVNKKHNGKFTHPLTTIIRQWLTEQNTRHITEEYDRSRPVAILRKGSLGNVRDVFLDPDGVGISPGVHDPDTEIKCEQLILFEQPGVLPTVLPFSQSLWNGRGKKTTKSGAVSHAVRLIDEAFYGLETGEMKVEIKIDLSILLQAFHPNLTKTQITSNRGKFIKTLIDALHEIQYLGWEYEINGQLGLWVPVKMPGHFVPTTRSPDDFAVRLSVELPFSENADGIMAVKKAMRLTGKRSLAQRNALRCAYWLIDQHGTHKGKLIDLTRPIENRDGDGNLTRPDGTQLRKSNGKSQKKLFDSDVVRQLTEHREPNPARKQYPVLTWEDLTRACYPQGYPSDKFSTYFKRAKTAWEALEAEGFIKLDKEHQCGWRVMPSQSHIQKYRGVKKSEK